MTTRTDLFEAIARMVQARSADNVCAVVIARVQRYSDLAATFGYETLDRVSDAMETQCGARCAPSIRYTASAKARS